MVFIGNWDHEREVFLEKIAAVFPLKIWGDARWKNDTPRKSALRSCWQGEALTGEAMARVLAQSAVVLNLFRRQHRAGGVVMRTFEVPGAGGFLLSETNDEVRRLFPENETGAYFRDADECLLQLRHWLDHPTERRALAQRAHERVVGRFTYTHLAETLLSSLETGQWPAAQDWC
ncbi:MAG: glycosyltransferase family 1 protein [Sphingobacteriaceae bacterium]|nr:glycosyltransferase family 1 protein [Cytophagaceae bacterium]